MYALVQWIPVLVLHTKYCSEISVKCLEQEYNEMWKVYGHRTTNESCELPTKLRRPFKIPHAVLSGCLTLFQEYENQLQQLSTSSTYYLYENLAISKITNICNNISTIKHLY